MLRGQPALLLDEAATRTQVPASRPREDRRSLTLDVAMQADGSATVDVVEEVRGAGAVAWRGQLESTPTAELERRFEEQYVSSLLPGGRLVEFSVEGRESGSGPVTFKYTVDLDVLGREVRDGWAIPSLLPNNLAASYAQLPARTSTQLVGHPLDTDVVLRLSFPEQASRPLAPQPVQLAPPAGPGSFTQSARWEDRVLVIERSARIPSHRISPSDYPAFAKFCRDVDEVEAREVVFGR